jgi:TolA-binding protein
MNSTEKRILSYPHLSRDEQREVEAYVDDHPEWAPLLRDVRKLEELAEEAGVPSASAPGADAPAADVLATYVVAQHLESGLGAETGRLQTSFQRIEAKIEENSDLQDQVAAMRRRIEDAESAVDPVAHFESLTGHRVSDFDAVDAAATDEPLYAAADNGTRDRVPEAGRRDDAVRAGDRDAQSPKRDGVMARIARSTPSRWAAAAVALFLVYGALYFVSWSSQSTLDRLAVVDVNEDVIESYQTRVRSPLPEAEEDTTADDLYLQALPLLRNARTSTLGLFPHFDHRKLREAESLLQRVVDQTEAGSFLRLEAYFYLGKVNLAQGEVETARSNFKRVVQREGRRATEAYQILKRLQEEYAADASSTSL